MAPTPPPPTPEALAEYERRCDAIYQRATRGEDVTADREALHRFMAAHGIGDTSTATDDVG